MRRRAVEPVLQLLRYGATPERLAWSIAAGVVIGLNPLLGSTTLIALSAAAIFRLNIVASQLGMHLAYPLELLLFPVFLRAGVTLFGSGPLPLEMRALSRAAREHPWVTTRLLWSWEWHAMVAWAGFAVLATPLLRMALVPVLAKLPVRLHDAPVVEK